MMQEVRISQGSVLTLFRCGGQIRVFSPPANGSEGVSSPAGSEAQPQKKLFFFVHLELQN